jgi:hypothetical protein
MRALWIAIALLVGGCYHPNIGSPGFFCHADDKPACPQDQTCVNGRCVDVAGPQDGAAPRDGAAPDDLSEPDMAHASCVASGGDCTYHKDSVCCSKYCEYSTNTCK